MTLIAYTTQIVAVTAVAPLMDDHGHDAPRGLVLDDAGWQRPATAAESGARQAITDLIELTGLLHEPGHGQVEGDAPPIPVKFVYHIESRTRRIMVAVVPPFDPTTCRRVARGIVGLCDDDKSGWNRRLRSRGRTVSGSDPVDFVVSYDPQTGRVTVTLDDRCTLPLLRWAAGDLAQKCDEVASPN
jgi:hypothetical protein